MAYIPTATPDDTPDGLKRWLADELRRIGTQLINPRVNSLQLETTGVEPSRPSNGMIVYADGTKWNPGSGEGFYGYENGSWVKL